MTKVIIALAVLTALSACAAPKPAGTDSFDNTYTLGGARYRSGHEVRIYTYARNAGGMTAVCGIVASTGAAGVLKDEFTADIINRTKVKVDGTTVLQNIRMFKVIKDRRPDVDETTLCVMTDLPWRPDAKNDAVAVVPRVISARA